MKKIGFSLSFCVRDIITGKVKESDVERIVTGTSVKTEKEWDVLIEQYQQVYWINNPAEGEAICRRLLKAGKIEQPLLAGKEAPDLSSGKHWHNLSPKERLAIVIGKMDFCKLSTFVGLALGLQFLLVGMIIHFLPEKLGILIIGIVGATLALKVFMPLLSIHDHKGCKNKFPAGYVMGFIISLYASLYALTALAWLPA